MPPCRRASSRFIHVSSVGVYGFGWRSGVPVQEDAEKLTPPLNNYNVSKWEGEKVVERYRREKGLRATIFRPAAIYGPRSEYGLYNAFDEGPPESRPEADPDGGPRRSDRGLPSRRGSVPGRALRPRPRRARSARPTTSAMTRG